ncbi:MAG: hypothetical protein Q8Q23_01700 [bacterium]|nr:hypothetical protein [bacterium]
MVNKKKNITIDDLAVMVQSGFEEAKYENNARFEKIEKELEFLKDGQEKIQLKLDNVAYRFELVELQKRVQLLEDKMLRSSKRY